MAMDLEEHPVIFPGAAGDISSAIPESEQLPQKVRTSLKTGAGMSSSDYENRLRSKFERAVAERKASILENEVDSNIIERFLWKDVLSARLKLIEDCLYLKEHYAEGRSWAFDAVSEMDASADIERHTRAIQNYQTARAFYSSAIGKLDVAEDIQLISNAAAHVTITELEHTEANLPTDSDDAKRLRSFIDNANIRAAATLNTLFDSPSWLAAGSRNSEFAGLRQFGHRLAMGIFGGLSLLVPMMIMVLNSTRLTNLVTTIAFVMFVAVILAGSMRKSQTQDVFAAVAAYTAVLVVFVGTSTSSGTQSDWFVGAIAGGTLAGLKLFLGVWFGTFYSLFLSRERKKTGGIFRPGLDGVS